MADMQTTRHVFLYCNYLGIVPQSVVVHSFLSNLNPDAPVALHLAHDARFEREGGVERLRGIVGQFPFARIDFRDFEPLYREFAAPLTPPGACNWPLLVWSWFFFRDLFPDITGNVLILDWDTLVRKDLSPLFDLDLKAGDFVAAAVNESRREDRPYLVAAGWPEEAGFSVNTAVMVIDVETYCADGMRDRMIAWYAAHKDVACCIEQDAFNAVCGTRILRLHPRYNCPASWLLRVAKDNFFLPEWRAFRPVEALEAMADPAVIHFIGGNKPWRPNHRPWRNAYRRVMRKLGLCGRNLPGETPASRLSGRVMDGYNALLMVYAKALLAIHKGRRR